MHKTLIECKIKGNWNTANCSETWLKGQKATLLQTSKNKVVVPVHLVLMTHDSLHSFMTHDSA